VSRLVVPWGSDVPEEKLRRLEDILGAYTSAGRGWDYMEIGGEVGDVNCQ
jgi:hypothetical protein